MTLLYIALGLSVNLVFLFRRELLIEKESFSLILGGSGVLFIAVIVLHFTAAGRYPGSGALLAPLPALLLFRFFRRWFVKWFGREPRDTFLNWNTGMLEDRIFNVVYWALGVGLVLLGMSGMESLTKAEW